MTRSSVLEIVRQDFVRSARAKGLAERAVVGRHVLKNAVNPVVTVLGIQVGTLLGGAILTETVFSWPGLGSMMVRAIQARDYPLVQGGVLLIATTFVGVNLLVDLLYAVFDPRIRMSDVARMFRRSHAAMFGLGLVVALALRAVLAPILTRHDPNEVDTTRRLARPLSPDHPLGTDEFGRDMTARLLHGARISLAVGLAATALAALAGSLCGLVAGLGGGWIDHAIMRSIDTLMAFPYFLLAIAIIAALGPGLVNGMIAVAVVNIPFYGRIVRGTVLAVRETEYVQAARALGVSELRLALKHVLRNCLAPIIVAVTLNVGGMITALAGLSFLGLGVQPPVSDWGSMLSSSRQYINVAPHVAALPGLAIFLAVLGFNLLGDGLRDALDPRLR